MANKNRGLAGFGSVADTAKLNVNHNTQSDPEVETDKSTKEETNLEFNVETKYETENENKNELKSIIDTVIGVQTLQPKKRQISAYIDEDVAKLLDKFGKKYGKGAKSSLINELLRNTLE